MMTFIRGRKEPPTPKTSFGELSVAEATPVVQISFPYNLNTQIVDVRDNGGTASVSGGLVSLSTGASANQSSQILSKVPIKYNPGQGGLYRGTAVFTRGVANSSQIVGVGDEFDGFFFGYSGVDFVARRVEKGKPEVRTLTVTTKSSTAENITITLDGDALATVAVTNGADVTVTANEISAADYSTTGTGWTTEAVGDTVIFISWDDGAKTGTYSLSSATTAVGAFAQTLAGVTRTVTDVTQPNWNVDKMDGSGPSEMILDPTKGNVYQIRYQWLGFGMITYFIENSVTGNFQVVHKIEFSNINTSPSLQNPTLPICMVATNTSNTTDIVLQSSSMAGFVEGRDQELGVLTGTSGTNTDVGTTEVPILSVRNKVVYQSEINRTRVKIQTLSVSTDAVNAVKIRVLLNPLLVASSWSDVSTNTSVMQEDTSATSSTGGTELFAFSMGKTDTQIIETTSMDMFVFPGTHITITAEALAGNTSDVVVSANWTEML